MEQTVRKTVLPNGIRILTKRMPQACSVSMGVWVNVGARDEALEESGLSHLIEHMLFKGTRRRTAYQIAKEFDAIGGQTNAFTAMETTCYHARVLDRHLGTMADILADIFLNSVFDPQEVDRERPVILQEIGMVEDSPEDYVHLLFGRDLWGENSLGRSILGTPANIAGFSAEAIRSFCRRCYQPQRTVIAAAGNLQHDHLVELLAPDFAAVVPGNGFPTRRSPGGRALVNVAVRALEQAHICIGTRGMATTDERRYAFSLLNTILGGNMSSRLFQEIREKRGLAYAVYSFITAFEDTGVFGTYLGVDPRQAVTAARLVLEQMERLKSARVGPSELQDAKEYTKGSLLLAAESVDNQMVRLAQGEMNFARYMPMQEVVARIEAVSAEDLLELARELFTPSQMVLTVLGPMENPQAFEDLLAVNASPQEPARRFGRGFTGGGGPEHG
jgi:predicted Zn-dependent peptidase